MITGDEKWIVYNNTAQKPQTTPKQNIHAKKVMLCIWWDCKGIVYSDLT